MFVLKRINPPEMEAEPLATRLLAITMLPVLLSPMVKDCLAVVAMTGFAEKIKFPAVVALPVVPKI